MDICARGKAYDGRKTTSFTLKGAGGVVLELLDYGGNIRSLAVPYRTGKC